MLGRSSPTESVSRGCTTYWWTITSLSMKRVRNATTSLYLHGLFWGPPITGWINQLSAGLRLPSARKKTVRGSHESIVKPDTKQSDAYEFVRDRIIELCRVRNESTLNDDLKRAARLRITVGLARLFSLRFLENVKAGKRYKLFSKESLRGEAYLPQFERQFDSCRNTLALRDVLILEEFIDFIKRTTAKWKAGSEIEYAIDSEVFKVWYTFFPLDAEDELREILWKIGGPLDLYFVEPRGVHNSTPQ